MTAQIIHDFIENLPYATRLYPSVYSQDLADTLAAQTITDAMVERAARTMFEDGSGDYSWDQMVDEDESRATIWRDDARAILTAALTPDKEDENDDA